MVVETEQTFLNCNPYFHDFITQARAEICLQNNSTEVAANLFLKMWIIENEVSLLILRKFILSVIYLTRNETIKLYKKT